MNEPTTNNEILRRLTYQQVIDEIEQRQPDIYVMAPYCDGDRNRFFHVHTHDYDGILGILKSDPDKADVESYFYLDFDLDLVLDPFNKP
jgi:hypothetical protein